MTRCFAPNTDCSEVAEFLLDAAGGEGLIQRYEAAGHEILIPEVDDFGVVVAVPFVYHEVYTDSRYVYDPGLSMTPIPKGDYERLLRQLNSGLQISQGQG